MSPLALKVGVQVISLISILLLELKFPSRLKKDERFNVWKVNFSIGIFNTLVFAFLINQFMFSVIDFTYMNDIGLFNLMGLSLPAKIICSVLVLDYVAYLWHIANHKYKILWRFHAAHHSDKFMEASTAYRFHIGELLISFGIRIIPTYFFAIPLEGLFAFEVVFNLSNLFVHSDIRLKEKTENYLGRFFITPKIHEIHHSNLKDQYNSNYGTIFSFWDKLQKTFTPFKEDQKIILGLKNYQDSNHIFKVLMIPFSKPDNS